LRIKNSFQPFLIDNSLLFLGQIVQFADVKKGIFQKLKHLKRYTKTQIKVKINISIKIKIKRME